MRRNRERRRSVCLPREESRVRHDERRQVVEEDFDKQNEVEMSGDQQIDLIEKRQPRPDDDTNKSGPSEMFTIKTDPEV